MRRVLALLACLTVLACSDTSDTRRLGGGGDVPSDATASIADSVLSTPIGYVDDRAPRTALVIGNGDYTTLGRLDNPANDARLVSRTLQNLGFRIEGGGPLLNLSGAQMRTAVARYRQSLASRGGVGVVYFAGHAVQVNGRNWLAPSDVRPRRLADVSAQFIPAEQLFGDSGGRDAVNMVILDACRDNPFQSQSGARSSPIPELRGTSAGLSRVVAPPDTLVAFATAPGAVALDGKGDNSPYATALARALAQPGTRVEDVFINVRNIVERSTNGFQTPWETSSLTKRVVLNANREGTSLSTKFDGHWVGKLKCGPCVGGGCEAKGDDNLSFSVTSGQGFQQWGPEWLDGQGGTRNPKYARYDFTFSEDGNVRMVGKYNKGPIDGRLILERNVIVRGEVEADVVKLNGHRGPRICKGELTRL